MEISLSPEDARRLDRHIEAVAVSRPNLSPLERRIAQGWIGEFARFVVWREGEKILSVLDQAATIDDYRGRVAEACRAPLPQLLTEAQAYWERLADSRYGPTRLAVKEKTSSRFLLVYPGQSNVESDIDLVSEVADQAYKAALEALGLSEKDLWMLPRLVLLGVTRRGERVWDPTDSRIPVFLYVSKAVADEMIPGQGTPGFVYAALRLKKLDPPPPRALGEVDYQLQCRIVYTNSLSLHVLAYTLARAVCILALADSAKIRPDLQFGSRDDLQRLFNDALPPGLSDEFVADGLADAIALRTPAIRNALPVEPLRELARSDAKAGKIATVREGPGAAYRGLFFDHLIARYGPAAVRSLLASPNADFTSAFQTSLKELEREWLAELSR